MSDSDRDSDHSDSEHPPVDPVQPVDPPIQPVDPPEDQKHLKQKYAEAMLNLFDEAVKLFVSTLTPEEKEDAKVMFGVLTKRWKDHLQNGTVFIPVEAIGDYFEQKEQQKPAKRGKTKIIVKKHRQSSEVVIKNQDPSVEIVIEEPKPSELVIILKGAKEPRKQKKEEEHPVRRWESGLSPCVQAVVEFAIQSLGLLLSMIGLPTKISKAVGKKLATLIGEAVKKNPSGYRKAVNAIKEAKSDKDKAIAVVEFLKQLSDALSVQSVLDAIKSEMSTGDWFWVGLSITANLLAFFATGGLAWIGKIIVNFLNVKDWAVAMHNVYVCCKDDK